MLAGQEDVFRHCIKKAPRYAGQEHQFASVFTAEQRWRLPDLWDRLRSQTGPCPLIEGFITLAINGGMMNENVTALIRLNKTKTFCRIKPLHFTFNHFTILLGVGLNLEPLKIWSFRHMHICKNGRQADGLDH
jgi:hypothetical protein